LRSSSRPEDTSGLTEKKQVTLCTERGIAKLEGPWQRQKRRWLLLLLLLLLLPLLPLLQLPPLQPSLPLPLQPPLEQSAHQIVSL